LFVMKIVFLSHGQAPSENDSTKYPNPKTITINEIQVNGRYENNNVTQGSNGVAISIKDIKLLPKFLGESDPYKARQYMGGVSQAGEANSGLYVRGGNNDQNLILFNGIPIFNPTHVMGMFSIFNPDIIGQLQFYKCGIPAEYGSRLSSVVD
jgi:ferric enterobactin receptor